jgi:hypothetical protein
MNLNNFIQMILDYQNLQQKILMTWRLIFLEVNLISK